MNWKEGTKIIGINTQITGTVVREMDDHECYGVQWDSSSYINDDYHIEWSGDLKIVTKLEKALK